MGQCWSCGNTLRSGGSSRSSGKFAEAGGAVVDVTSIGFGSLAGRGSDPALFQQFFAKLNYLQGSPLEQLRKNAELISQHFNIPFLSIVGLSDTRVTCTPLASAGNCANAARLYMPEFLNHTPNSSTARVVHGKGRLTYNAEELVKGQGPPDWLALHQNLGLCSFVAAPIYVASEVVGVMTLAHHSASFFETQGWHMHIEMLAAFAGRLFQDSLLTSYCSLLGGLNTCNSLDSLVKAISRGATRLLTQKLLHQQIQCRVALIKQESHEHAGPGGAIVGHGGALGSSCAIMFEEMLAPSISSSDMLHSNTALSGGTPALYHSALSEGLSNSLPRGFMRFSTSGSLHHPPAESTSGNLVPSKLPLSAKLMYARRSATYDPNSHSGPFFSSGRSTNEASSSHATVSGRVTGQTDASSTAKLRHSLTPTWKLVPLPQGGSQPATRTPWSLLDHELSSSITELAIEGHCFLLKHSLLGKAMKGHAGLWVSDCMALMSQESGTILSDLLLAASDQLASSLVLAPMYRGAGSSSTTPWLALYLCTPKTCAEPFLEMLLESLTETMVVLEPLVASKLQSDLAAEWSYLQQEVLVPEKITNPNLGRASSNAIGSIILEAADSEAGEASALSPRLALELEAAEAGRGVRNPMLGRVSPVPEGSARLSPDVPDLVASTLSTFPLDMSVSEVSQQQLQDAAVQLPQQRPSLPPQLRRPSQLTSALRVAQWRGQQQQQQPGMPNPSTAGSIGGDSHVHSPLHASRRAQTLEANWLYDTCSEPCTGLDTSERIVTETAPVLTGRHSWHHPDGTPGPLHKPAGIEAASSPSFKVTSSPSFKVALSNSHHRRLSTLVGGFQDRVQQAQRQQVQQALYNRPSDLQNLGLIERIGGGGFGTVYLGTYNGSEVAVKVIEERGTKSNMLSNALELAVLSTMSHPSIVQVLTFFTDVMVCPIEGAPLPLLLLHGDSSQDQSTYAAMAGAGEPKSSLVIVMEYCDCSSLSEAVDQGVRLAGARVLGSQPLECAAAMCREAVDKGVRLAGWKVFHDGIHVAGIAGAPRWLHLYQTLFEVASALRYLHSLHLVHRDVKPANVLLKSSNTDPRGFTVKLTDFGLVRPSGGGVVWKEDAGDAEKGGSSSALPSLSWHFSGTTGYLPPEAFPDSLERGIGVAHVSGERRLDNTSPAQDIYAFGILMYEVLTGDWLYRGLTDLDIMQRVRGGQRPEFSADTPSDYRELAQRCWSADPSSRPTSEQLVLALGDRLAGLRARQRPQHRSRRQVANNKPLWLQSLQQQQQQQAYGAWGRPGPALPGGHSLQQQQQQPLAHDPEAFPLHIL